MMAVSVRPDDASIEPDRPIPLFDAPFLRLLPAAYEYDATADGQSFVIIVTVADFTAPPLTVMVN